jgi:hypothetical protein
MRYLLISLILLLGMNSPTRAQFLAQFDSVLLRSGDDECVVATEPQIVDLQRVFGFDATLTTISEHRFYRKKGQTDIRVNVYLTTGPEAGRLLGLFSQYTYWDAIRDWPTQAARLSDGTTLVFYPAGLSANDGLTQECIMPLLKHGSFIRITSNSIGYMESGNTQDFENRFRTLALRYCEIVRKSENESSSTSSTDKIK